MIYYLYMNTAIFIVALIGLAISYKILYNKRHEIHVCPIGSNCKTVLASKHNKMFGIPNEINGIIYYGIIVLAYGITLFDYEPIPALKAFLLTATAGAFLFSIYLTLIQGIQLKKWCTWCLGSAMASTAIFVLTFLYTIPYLDSIIDFLSTQRSVMIFTYSLGFALGLGAITISYFLLYKFLEDFKITKKEKEVFHYVTQVVWIGLFLILISGIGFFLTVPTSVVAILQMIILFTLLVSEGFITLFAIPHLSKISVKRKDLSDKLCSWRRSVFAIGAISLASWYTSFVLAYISPSYFSLYELLFFYAGILIMSVMASQLLEMNILERYLSAQKKK